MGCYAAMGPPALQSSVCHAYIWNDSTAAKNPDYSVLLIIPFPIISLMSSLWGGISGDERFVGRGGFSDLNKEYSWKKQADFGEALLHAAVQCGAGVAAEWSVGYQRFRNSSVSFYHSRGSNRGYHLTLQIWPCFWDGRLGLHGKVLVVGGYKGGFSEKVPEASLMSDGDNTSQLQDGCASGQS